MKDRLGVRIARRRGCARVRESGFTLIEAVILIAVVTIGLAAIMYLMAVSEGLNIDSHDTTAAYAAANDLMEYYRQQPFTSLVDTANAQFGSQAGQIGYNNLSQLINSQGLYTIADYGGNTDIKQLTVSVSWSRHKTAERDQSISLVTLVAQDGLNERWK